MQTWSLTRAVYEDIRSTFAEAPIESGGILGERNGVVCRFFFDRLGRRDAGSYIPHTASLNRIIEDWADEGIAFGGIIHSHPHGVGQLSPDDRRYFEEIYALTDGKRPLYAPVVIYEGRDVRLCAFAYDGRDWFPAEICLVDG